MGMLESSNVIGAVPTHQSVIAEGLVCRDSKLLGELKINYYRAI
jgi:hypothetical protein